MRVAPVLDEAAEPGLPRPRLALLVNPFYPKDPHASFGKHVLTPSLALTSVAAATPANWEVRFWDENSLQGPPPLDPMPAVVGITVHLTFADRAYRLARWFRDRGAKVIFGGLHVQACHEEAAPHADAVAIGNGVELWPRILADIEAGQLKPLYRAGFAAPYAEEPPPRRELVPRSDFLTTASVIATRGCHSRCGFCYLATKGMSIPYQMRRPADVAAEIAATGEPYAVFIDNNLGSRREYLHELCRALEPLGIIWSAAVSIDTTDDPSVIRAMALAGCTGVFIGFETLTGENLVEARKKTPRPEDYARRVALFHDNGIQVNGSFVFGFDEDGPDCFERTVGWTRQNRLESATYHILTPYPGTPLFRRMEAEGRLLHRDWSLYDTSHVVFRPKRMTEEQLADGYAYAYRETFSWRGILARRPRGISEAIQYVAMSVLYKQSNRLWPWLIRHRLTHRAWAPLVSMAAARHRKFREKLRATPEPVLGPAPVLGWES